MEQGELAIEDDRGLPHGRAWVVAKGCSCPECAAARRRLDREVVAEDRKRPPLSRAERNDQDRLSFYKVPRFVKHGSGAWVVTQPPGRTYQPGETVVVERASGDRVAKRVTRQRGHVNVGAGVTLPVWAHSR